MMTVCINIFESLVMKQNMEMSSRGKYRLNGEVFPFKVEDISVYFYMGENGPAVETRLRMRGKGDN